MQTSTLITLFFILALLLVLLTLLYTKSKKKRIKKVKISQKTAKEIAKIPTFDTLYATIKDHTSSQQALKEASEAIIEHYGTIPAKRGITPDPLFKKYATIIIALTRHPNTHKDIIVNFDRALQKRNPNYAFEIEDFLQKGLNSRG